MISNASQAKPLGTAAILAALLATISPSLRADAIDDYLRREMELRKIPGLAWAVVENGAMTR